MLLKGRSRNTDSRLGKPYDVGCNNLTTGDVRPKKNPLDSDTVSLLFLSVFLTGKLLLIRRREYFVNWPPAAFVYRRLFTGKEKFFLACR